MEKEHIIINVGRQLGSGGRTIAQRLANDFNAKFYDKEILNIAAKESGFSEKFFEQNDEQKGFLKTFFHLHAPHLADNSFYKSDFSQDSLFQFQSEAIQKAAQKESCVFVGRCADYVLRNFNNVVNIFITANWAQRVAAVSQRHQCDEATARKIINDKESSRASFYNYYTGKKWGHAESYDLCVNSSILGWDGTVRLIETFIKQKLQLPAE